MELRDPKALADGFEGREDLARLRPVVWRRLALQGLSVGLAILWAWLVVLFAGGLAWERDAIEAIARPAIAGAPALPRMAPGFDAEELRGRLEEIEEGHEGVYGVTVLEPDSGAKVSLRRNKEFMGASIGKLPVLAALYRAAARGELDLDEEIPLLPEDIQEYGSGGLNGFPLGYSMSLRECAYRLVNYSDNTAWAMLDRRLGEDKIRAELDGMGLKNSSYSGHLSAYYTTPSDVLLLLERISDPRYTNEELSAEMLDAMTDTAFEDRIPERLPQEVRVAHKTGSYDDNFGDAGVVFYKDRQGVEKHYYLVVLSSGAGEYEASDAIQEMSLAVYEALVSPS